MSTTALNDTETRTLIDRLLKRDEKADEQLSVADALAKLIEDYGDDEVGSLVLDAYSDEIVKAANPITKAAPAAPAGLSAIESKIDALITLVQGLVADENEEEGSENEPVTKSGTDEKPSTDAAPVRDALLKAGVPGPLVESLSPALASPDAAAAAAARDTLAKLAGTHDIAKLLKESGTTKGAPEQPEELSEDEKQAISAMVAGL